VQVGGQNSWVIDALQRGDVMVVDCFGKIKDGTFVGDNLSTSLSCLSIKPEYFTSIST
jgi:regulator of RNase E activity RraA